MNFSENFPFRLQQEKTFQGGVSPARIRLRGRALPGKGNERADSLTSCFGTRLRGAQHEAASLGWTPSEFGRNNHSLREKRRNYIEKTTSNIPTFPPPGTRITNGSRPRKKTTPTLLNSHRIITTTETSPVAFNNHCSRFSFPNRFALYFPPPPAPPPPVPPRYVSRRERGVERQRETFKECVSSFVL